MAVESRRLLAALLAALLAGGCGGGRAVPRDPVSGDSLYARGDYAGARQAWRAELAQASASSARAAHLLTSVSLAAYHLADYAEARRTGDSALSLARSLGIGPREHFRTVNALGLVAWHQGRLDTAGTLFRDALRLATAANDTPSMAKASGNLGLVLTDYGDFTAARSAFRTAQSAAHAIGDRKTEGNAFTNLAMLAQRTGELPSAEDYVTEALRLFRQIGYETGEQNALGQRVTIDEAKGDPRAAFATLDSALAIVKRLGLKQEEASDLEIFGDLYAEAGDLRSAALYYDRAQRLFATSDIQLEAANVLRAQSGVAAALGDTLGARERAHEARRIHQALGATAEELNDRLAEIELAQPNDGAVSAMLDSAEALAGEMGGAAARSRVVLARATIAERRGDWRRVLALLATTRDLERAGNDWRWRAAALRARAFARLGRLDSAEMAGRAAVQFVERSRHAYGGPALRTMFENRQQQLYAELVSVLVAEHKMTSAFETADATAGRTLAEHLTSARSQLDRRNASGLLDASALAREIDTLTARVEELESAADGAADGDGDAMQRELRDRLARARSEYDAIMARTDVGEEAHLLGLTTMSVGRIQSSLEPAEALIEYFATSDTLFTFVVTGRAIRVLAQSLSRDRVNSQVRVFRGVLAARPTSSTLGAADDLYNLLITPAVRSGALEGVKRLIIVPRGVLTYLPFAALRDRAQGQFLIEQFVLAFLPAASALPVLRAPDRFRVAAARGSGTAAGFAPLTHELPATAIEVQRFKERIPNAIAYAGVDASERVLRDALSAGAIVHVATHAVFNATNPMFSEIRLARGAGGGRGDDGKLQLFEVFGLRVRSPLVFLSGCETGVGASGSTEFERGEDFATLSRAFLFAGARNVIATLWRIDDAGAAALADRFYAHLGSSSAVDALALAQREMLRDARFGAAYYWAGYQASGAGR